MTAPRLHVNVDHVATLRQQRGTIYPDPVAASALAESAGAHGITVHLREDRRHIQERDVEVLRKTVRGVLNLEMAATPAMIAFALRLQPDLVTLVPERREERTTEGGLDVAGAIDATGAAVRRLRDGGLDVSLFIDPEVGQVDAARRAGATCVELHTGDYCLAPRGEATSRELRRLERAAGAARAEGLRIAAGHGLYLDDVGPVAAIPGVEELNIGHGIVARAVLVGFERAVAEMIAAIRAAAP